MKNKNLIVLLIILFVISIISIVFVYNDYFLYKRPILKISSIKEEVETSEMTNEKYYTQTIYGTIKNGKYKGNKVQLINHATKSGVYDERFHKKSELFVELTNNGKEVVSFSQIKRDKYLVILLVIFLDLILLVAGKKGVKTLISLAINIIISMVAIFTFQEHYKTLNMLILYFGISIMFIITSLFITNGKGKKTLAAVSSAIASMFISFGLAFFVIKIYGKPLPYWTLEYIEAVHQYENFFYVTILLSGLGAIMDISITISSSLNELIVKDPKIKLKNLVKSGREISKDIVGTMTNVMLFTCYTSIIPLALLLIKNNIILGEAISRYGKIELIVVLTSCIAIVLAIPISLFISTFILKPQNSKGGNK
ncbi:MAG: YibE/F family protein [Bacilli bacterium]|nr:YibE/F family protein [Bacilli bacterium]